MATSNPIKKNHITVAGNIHSDRIMISAHGFSVDQTVWVWVAAAFRREPQVIFYDSVGAGKSDPEAVAEPDDQKRYREAGGLCEK